MIAAAQVFDGTNDEVEATGLTDLLLDPPSAKAATTAIRALRNYLQPVTFCAIAHTLHSRWPFVRSSAVRFLATHDLLSANKSLAEWSADLRHLLIERLQVDPSWAVRRDVFQALAAHSSNLHELEVAASDPHWRIRHAFAEYALAYGNLGPISSASTCRSQKNRIAGLRAYMEYRRTGKFEFESPMMTKSSLYDPDPAVMARELNRFRGEKIQQHLPAFPELLWHSDERIRKSAAGYLLEFGSAEQLAEVSCLLDDPREFGWPDAVQLLGTLGPARAREVARLVISDADVSPARATWARLELGEDAEPKVSIHERMRSRLPLSANSVRRAELLTREQADALIENPETETSWIVLRQACRVAKHPFQKICPPVSWQPEPTAKRSNAFHSDEPSANATRCPRVKFGEQQVEVSRMGLSGHYRLPEAGFAHAMDAGINFIFWEPNYDTMTQFVRSLSVATRRSVHVIAGSFGADARAIRLDAERALRNLRIERLTLFQLFWVRSWNRITDEVRTELDALRSEGKIQMYGLSTHNRLLATEAIDAGWNPVMVRHSLAHRGAEVEIFPLAVRKQTSIITFNNTCYGRLLRGGAGMNPPTAEECYRYTLAQPAVSCCLTAPATIEQLKQNLTTVAGETSAARFEKLKQHGDAVYEHDRYFRLSVRSV